MGHQLGYAVLFDLLRIRVVPGDAFRAMVRIRTELRGMAPAACGMALEPEVLGGVQWRVASASPTYHVGEPEDGGAHHTAAKE